MWAVIVALFGTLVPWVWQAAKYPDRSEFEAAKMEMKDTEKRVTSDVQRVREETIEIKTDLRHIKESQARIERLLETVLNRRLGK
jgi:hypothetical protein